MTPLDLALGLYIAICAALMLHWLLTGRWW